MGIIWWDNVQTGIIKIILAVVRCQIDLVINTNVVLLFYLGFTRKCQAMKNSSSCDSGAVTRPGDGYDLHIRAQLQQQRRKLIDQSWYMPLSGGLESAAISHIGSHIGIEPRQHCECSTLHNSRVSLSSHPLFPSLFPLRSNPVGTALSICNG